MAPVTYFMLWYWSISCNIYIQKICDQWTMLDGHQTTSTWEHDLVKTYLHNIQIFSMLRRNLKWQKWEIKRQGRVLHVNVKDLLTLLIFFLIIFKVLSYRLASRCCGGRVCHRALYSSVCSTLRKSGSDSNQLFPASRRSAAHTHTRVLISSWGHSDVMHSSLPSLTTNTTPKYRKQALINHFPKRLI